MNGPGCDERRERDRARWRARDRARTRENRRRINELKASPCEDCGSTHRPELMHFHHVDPETKSFTIGRRLTRSWARLQAEIDKCALLCVDCHRQREGHRPYWTSEEVL